MTKKKPALAAPERFVVDLFQVYDDEYGTGWCWTIDHQSNDLSKRVAQGTLPLKSKPALIIGEVLTNIIKGKPVGRYYDPS